MLPIVLRSVTKLRVVARPAPVASTQTRSLYFGGPKACDRDPNLPIPEHYHARSRRTDSDATVIAESLLRTPNLSTPAAQPATPTPALRISVTHIPSLPARHTIPSTDKLETARKATAQLEVAAHHDAITDNTTTVLMREIARVEGVLRKGEAEGKNWQELQKVREDIEGLKSLFDKIGRI